MNHVYDHRSFTGFSPQTAPLSRAEIADELARAHTATQRLNVGYDVPEPARLSLRYAWNDREESLARGLLRGIVAFFRTSLPRWALRPRAAPVELHPVVPPG